MRARNIKPGFYKNHMLASCEPLARILFTGLWALADRDGRLEDIPERIKVEVLPYDMVDPDALLNDLKSRGFIDRYIVKGQPLIQVINFTKHQRPHTKEPSLFASKPEKFQAEPEINQAEPGKGADKPALNAESLILNPSSLNAENSCPENTGPSKQKSIAPRPRDDLFDAVAEVTASDPKSSGSRIGRVCKLLRSADPAYTPDEVRKWAKLVTSQKWWDGMPPSLNYVEQRIGLIRHKGPMPLKDDLLDSCRRFAER